MVACKVVKAGLSCGRCLLTAVLVDVGWIGAGFCLSWHGECHPAGEAASVPCRAVQAAVKALRLFMALLAAGAAVPCGCGYHSQPSGCCGPPALVVCVPSSS